jgi:hypothetical protein
MLGMTPRVGLRCVQSKRVWRDACQHAPTTAVGMHGFRGVNTSLCLTHSGSQLPDCPLHLLPLQTTCTPAAWARS